MSPRIFAKVRLTPIAMAYFIANPPALSMPGQGGFFVARAGYGKIAVPYPVTYLYLPFRAKQKARKPAEMLGKLVCLPKLACKNKRVGYGVRNKEHKGGCRSAPPLFSQTPTAFDDCGGSAPAPPLSPPRARGAALLPLRDSVLRVAAASPERLYLPCGQISTAKYGGFAFAPAPLSRQVVLNSYIRSVVGQMEFRYSH